MQIVTGDIKDLPKLEKAMAGHDTVIHLASNPDIARAATEPMIDFEEGTLLTQMVVEAMRRTGAGKILYASGSGVYGDLGHKEAAEDYAPMQPVSTYGASKLAGENLISAYAHMFGISGIAFRFGNVVGPRQTHGVGLDFIKKLKSKSKGPGNFWRRLAEQILCLYHRHSRRRLYGRRQGRQSLRGIQCGHRRLHNR